MSLPIRKPLLPSAVANAQNGMLPVGMLAAVSPGRLMEATLCAPAMQALVARVAVEFGWELGTTGDYRPLQQQWDGFGGRDGRYEPCTYEQYTQRRAADKAARRKNTTKVWPTARRNEVKALLGPQKFPIPDETYWRLINPRSLNSAVPGTSNHGKGGSRDIAKIVRRFLRFWRRTAVALSAAEREQLATVILDYGYAWETLNDLPHITWFLGDRQAPALENDMAAGIQVHAPGDIGVFLVDAGEAQHLSGKKSKALVGVTGEPKEIGRDGLDCYYLTTTAPGDLPDGHEDGYPVGWTGPRTFAADFRKRPVKP